MAVTRAPKKGAKAGKSKSKPAAKKSSVKKPVAKKVKPAKKVVKIPQKAVLDAKDVAQIAKVKELVVQQRVSWQSCNLAALKTSIELLKRLIRI